MQNPAPIGGALAAALAWEARALPPPDEKPPPFPGKVSDYRIVQL